MMFSSNKSMGWSLLLMVHYLKRFEQWHVVDEALVHESLLVSDLVYDPPERLSVHGPQDPVSGR